MKKMKLKKIIKPGRLRASSQPSESIKPDLSIDNQEFDSYVKPNLADILKVERELTAGEEEYNEVYDEICSYTPAGFAPPEVTKISRIYNDGDDSKFYQGLRPGESRQSPIQKPKRSHEKHQHSSMVVSGYIRVAESLPNFHLVTFLEEGFRSCDNVQVIVGSLPESEKEEDYLLCQVAVGRSIQGRSVKDLPLEGYDSVKISGADASLSPSSEELVQYCVPYRHYYIIPNPSKQIFARYYVRCRNLIRDDDRPRTGCQCCSAMATEYCLSDKMFFCGSCSHENHPPSDPIRSNHVIIRSASAPGGCERHVDKDAVAYCRTCKEAACIACLMPEGDHNGPQHTCVELEKAYGSEVGRLRQLENDKKVVMDTLEEAFKAWTERRRKVESNRTALEGQIREMCAELQRQLVGEVNKIADDKALRIDSEIEEIRRRWQQLDSAHKRCLYLEAFFPPDRFLKQSESWLVHYSGVPDTDGVRPIDIHADMALLNLETHDVIDRLKKHYTTWHPIEYGEYCQGQEHGQPGDRPHSTGGTNAPHHPYANGGPPTPTVSASAANIGDMTTSATDLSPTTTSCSHLPIEEVLRRDAPPPPLLRRMSSSENGPDRPLSAPVTPRPTSPALSTASATTAPPKLAPAAAAARQRYDHDHDIAEHATHTPRQTEKEEVGKSSAGFHHGPSLASSGALSHPHVNNNTAHNPQQDSNPRPQERHGQDTNYCGDGRVDARFDSARADDVSYKHYPDSGRQGSTPPNPKAMQRAANDRAYGIRGPRVLPPGPVAGQGQASSVAQWVRQSNNTSDAESVSSRRSARAESDEYDDLTDGDTSERLPTRTHKGNHAVPNLILPSAEAHHVQGHTHPESNPVLLPSSEAHQSAGHLHQDSESARKPTYPNLYAHQNHSNSNSNSNSNSPFRGGPAGNHMLAVPTPSPSAIQSALSASSGTPRDFSLSPINAHPQYVNNVYSPSSSRPLSPLPPSMGSQPVYPSIALSPTPPAPMRGQSGTVSHMRLDDSADDESVNDDLVTRRKKSSARRLSQVMDDESTLNERTSVGDVCSDEESTLESGEE